MTPAAVSPGPQRSRSPAAGTEAGPGEPVLLAVITTAERVSADAAAWMAQHARREPPGGVSGAAPAITSCGQPSGSGETGQAE
jgi:hypothetical protein